MSLFTDLREVFTAYAQRIKSLTAADEEIKADLGDKVKYTHSSSTSLKNCDLDDIVTPGSYRITTISNARTVANIPEEQGGVLLVSIMQTNTAVWQRYIVLTANIGVRIYDRVQSSGTWRPWFVNTTSFDNVKKLSINNADYISIQSGSDLNDITTVGSYKSTSASVTATLLNKPRINTGFLLLVSNVTSDSVFLQVVIDASATSLVFLRYINPTSDLFGEWHKIQYDDVGIESTLAALGKSITSNTTRISILEAQSGIEGDYFTQFEEQEQALYDKVNADIDNDTLVFVVSADNHYRESDGAGVNQDKHAKVMAQMAERLRADAIINLGDIITQHTNAESENNPQASVNTERLAKMATAFCSGTTPFLYTFAHHEMCLGSNGPTSTDNTTQTSVYPYPREKVLGLCGKGYKWLTEHHYSQDRLSAGYYVDFDAQKVRVIFYDSVSYSACGYTPASIAFISEAFSTVPAGYKVIVCTHVASRQTGVSSFTVKNWEQVSSIMSDFVSSGGTILAELSGHEHFDNIVWIDGVSYPYVTTCCAENSWSTVREKIEAGVLGNPVSYRAHAASKGALGTYNEYLFDVACVHPDRNTINFFRFGIGEDRTVTLPNE